MERLRILLSGMVAGDPHQGGASWAVLQYLAGLRALGHEVVLVEPLKGPMGPDPLGRSSEVIAYFESLPLLDRRAALLFGEEERRTVGMPYDELVRFAGDADLLINVSGMLRDERLLESIPIRLFLDLDPGFNQVWHSQGEDMGLALHTHFATIGLRVGREGCPVPTCGRSWIHTLPPVVLDLWPPSDPPGRGAPFTSVGHWRSYGSVEHDGVRYGQRAHSLRGLFELPKMTVARFQLALGIHPDEVTDLEALHANGWELVDPLEVVGTPEAYVRYIRDSRGELSVAKQGYVSSRSGWFSDRSACYLASGRPVVAQDTGFGEFLPAGEGLVMFDTALDAAAGVEEVNAAWERHSTAARRLAEEYLDASRVLSQLLTNIGGDTL